MSVPLGLRIGPDKIFDMPAGASADLYGYLEPQFTDRLVGNVGNDYADRFIGSSFGGRMTFSHLPAAEYRQACAWVFEAADRFESLRPYKDGLAKALKSDPRYKAV